MRIRLLVILFLLALPTRSRAVLEWKDDLVVRRAAASDTFVTAQFVFRNGSSKPITITSVRPSCHCTTTDLESRPYAPGETGVVTARVDIAGRRGLVENTIEVVHQDGNLIMDRLRLNIEVAGVARVTPTFHFWALNGRTDTKMSVIVPIVTGVFSILNVEASNSDFAWSLARQGGRQELRIAPRNISRRTRTVFKITMRAGDEIAVQTVYAHIK